jgi:hypothetical protein
MVVGVVGWVIPIRQIYQPSNAFADYAAILPGQPHSAVVGMNFSCNSSNRSGTSDYCTRAPADGPFSLVSVTLSNGIISRVSFTVRDNRVAIGDLALLWGRPSIRLYGKSAVFEWSNPGVYANGWVESKPFSYAIPVLRLSFGSPEISATSS